MSNHQPSTNLVVKLLYDVWGHFVYGIKLYLQVEYEAIRRLENQCPPPAVNAKPINLLTFTTMVYNSVA